MRGSFRPPGGRYAPTERPPGAGPTPLSVKEQLDRRYAPRCDALQDWAAAGGPTVRPRTTVGVSIRRSLRLGASKFKSVKRSKALAVVVRAERAAASAAAEARAPPPRLPRPRAARRPATVAAAPPAPVAAAVAQEEVRPATAASERPATAPELREAVENDADEEAAFLRHAQDRWDAAPSAAPAPEGWPSGWPRVGGEGWVRFPGGLCEVDEAYDGRAGFYRLLKACREAGDAAAFKALAAWTSGSAKYRDLVAAAERAGTGPARVLAMRLEAATRVAALESGEAATLVVAAALEACHALAPHPALLAALAKANLPKRVCAAVTRAADLGEAGGDTLRHGCLFLELWVRADGPAALFAEIFESAGRALAAARASGVEAACALVASLAAKADDAQLTHMLALVPALEQVTASSSKEKIYERQAANAALQKLSLIACSSVEALMARPPEAKEDPAELERRRLEAEREAKELAFLETPPVDHARALVKACDSSKNAKLTLGEVQMAASHKTYGEFVAWLVDGRAREFKRRAVEMALSVTELAPAVADFQELIRATRRAREEDFQARARRRDAAVDEEREAALARTEATRRRAAEKEAALRRISPAEWAARRVMRDADDSGNGEVSKNELQSCLARRSRFAAFLTWLLADFRGVVDVQALTAHVRVYLREVHDDDALNAVARRPDDTYPREKPARRPESRVSHDDASLDGSIRIEISSR